MSNVGKIKSKYIQVFPCSWRGNYIKYSQTATGETLTAKTVFDPEARYSTEPKLRQVISNLIRYEDSELAKNSRSVVLSENWTLNNSDSVDIFSFILNGYCFNIINAKSQIESLINTDYPSATDLYAHIYLESDTDADLTNRKFSNTKLRNLNVISATSTTVNAGELDCEDSPEDPDKRNLDDYYHFHGLIIDNSKTGNNYTTAHTEATTSADADNHQVLHILTKSGNDWVVPKHSKMVLNKTNIFGSYDWEQKPNATKFPLPLNEAADIDKVYTRQILSRDNGVSDDILIQSRQAKVKMFAKTEVNIGDVAKTPGSLIKVDITNKEIKLSADSNIDLDSEENVNINGKTSANIESVKETNVIGNNVKLHLEKDKAELKIDNNNQVIVKATEIEIIPSNLYIPTTLHIGPNEAKDLELVTKNNIVSVIPHYTKTNSIGSSTKELLDIYSQNSYVSGTATIKELKAETGTFSSTLGVTGTATFGNNVDFKNFTDSSACTFTNYLYTVLKKRTNIQADCEINGTLTANGVKVIGGVDVKGSVAAGSLSSAGVSNLRGALNVSGTATMADIKANSLNVLTGTGILSTGKIQTSDSLIGKKLILNSPYVFQQSQGIKDEKAGQTMSGRGYYWVFNQGNMAAMFEHFGYKSSWPDKCVINGTILYSFGTNEKNINSGATKGYLSAPFKWIRDNSMQDGFSVDNFSACTISDLSSGSTTKELILSLVPEEAGTTYYNYRKQPYIRYHLIDYTTDTYEAILPDTWVGIHCKDDVFKLIIDSITVYE